MAVLILVCLVKGKIRWDHLRKRKEKKKGREKSTCFLRGALYLHKKSINTITLFVIVKLQKKEGKSENE